MAAGFPVAWIGAVLLEADVLRPASRPWRFRLRRVAAAGSAGPCAAKARGPRRGAGPVRAFSCTRCLPLYLQACQAGTHYGNCAAESHHWP